MKAFRAANLQAALFVAAFCATVTVDWLPSSRCAAADPFAAQAEAADAIVPLVRSRNTLHVAATMNGVEAGFLVIDTGSSGTVVFKDTAKKLGLAVTKEIVVNSLRGKQKLGVAGLNRFKVGQVGVGSHPVLVSSTPDVVMKSGDRVAGVVGMDVLGRQPFTLNFREATLTIHRGSAAPSGKRFGLHPLGDTPKIRAAIEGSEGWFELDTGFSGSILLSSGFVRLNPDLVFRRPRINEEPVWHKPAWQYNVRWRDTTFLGNHAEEGNTGSYQAEDGIDWVAGLLGNAKLQDVVLTIDMKLRSVWVQWLEPEPRIRASARLTDPKWRDLSGLTPLMKACFLERPDVALDLLDSGAAVNGSDQWGYTALMIACARGDVAMVELLLDRGAEPNLANSFDGYTALAYAAVGGRARTVDRLLARGASIDQSLISGRTPLFLAAEGGHSDVVALLAENGADVNKGLSSGEIPLVAACSSGSEESVAILLSYKGNPNAGGPGGNCLTYAAQAGSVASIRRLIKAGANVNSPAANGLTPLAAGASNAFTGADCVLALLDAGADVSTVGPDGKTALDYAVEAGSISSVLALKAHIQCSKVASE